MLLRALAVVARLCALAIVLAALQSFAYVTWVPLWLQVAIAVVPGLLVLWRPIDGLQSLAAFVPLIAATGQRFGTPVLPFAEAMVLSAIAGGLARSFRVPLVAPPALRTPLWLFGLTVAASLAVELSALQLRTDAPAAFTRSFAHWLTHAYFTEHYPAVTAAALLLEGLGLLWITAAVCADDRTASLRLLRMVVLGASAAAFLNVTRLAMSVVRSPSHLQAIRELFGRVRVNIHFSDVNAAASQFALALGIAAGLAAVRGRSRMVWIACAGTLVAGLWVAGSRAAFAAIAVVLLAAAVRIFVSAPRTIRARAGAAVGVGVVALVLLVAAPRMRLDSDAREAFGFRVEMLKTSLRMARPSLVFGVGVGRFYSEFPQFSTPALLMLYSHENAHNNFLQVLAELGVAGLVTFLALLYAAGSGAIRSLGKIGSPLWTGVAAGLAACAITMFSGHPLLIPEVAFTFWLVLGAWSAQSAAAPATARSSRWRWLLPAAAATILLSLVVRVPAARRAVNLEHVEYGFSGPVREPTGERYRRINGQATFFAPADPALANGIELPMMSDGGPATVEFSFDGRPGDRRRITGEWGTVRLSVLPSSQPFRRVDIRTDRPVRVGRIKYAYAVAYQPGPRRSIQAGDFDGDGRTDIVLYRPETGAWHIKLSSSAFTRSVVTLWGAPGDIPVTGDYDGDGLADTGVFRPSSGDWLIQPWGHGLDARITQMWGLPGDIPVPGDYDGDGRTDLAVYRPAEGSWIVRESRTGHTESLDWGEPGDVPVPGDYDGDGRDDPAVFRPSQGRWYVSLPKGNLTVEWGLATDYAVPGDFDGDGAADFVVWRPSAGQWFIRSSRTGETRVVTFGRSGDVPVPGHYISSDRMDVGIFRPGGGQWYFPTVEPIDFGRAGDVAVLAAKRAAPITGAATPAADPR
ncbi:MAG: FG-GAP-like repeat-containing protein [Acidobacteriota bacterium]